MSFCFGAFRARNSKPIKQTMDGQDSSDYCIFCDIVRGTTSTTILYSDDKVVAFPDINPSAFRHYLVIPVEHVPTVNSLDRIPEHYELVDRMLKVGKDLLSRDAPNSVEHRFGFHQPPFNSINHLHLHCLALPFIPAWRQVKYTPLGRIGFIDANNMLEKLKPRPAFPL
ncbi:Histidine triad nucleotide-binding protein 3 [Rhynchospora pubera]|uniref:Histidine triad nucleotide-binding protein 3 n=1 Tax=Rhynchospora pubera TaxID=906938 RepID=A0AAV8H2L7_9POAL|nr:Histidine triad nucleotide-binding protein 3 [Rhynchospora pubera]